MIPITYGRRAVKRARSSVAEHPTISRRSSHERPAKQAKILAEISPASTDVEDEGDPLHTTRNQSNHNPSRASSSLKDVRRDNDATPRDMNYEVSTIPGTPPADVRTSRPSKKTPVTYLARTPTKSQTGLAKLTDSDLPSGSPSRKVVKDLSGVFDLVSPPKSMSTTSSSTTTTGIAKRMLSRSRTMPSIENSTDSIERSRDSLSFQPATNADITRGTSSAGPSSRSLTPTKISKSLSFDSAPSTPVKTQNSTLRTYAGSSRSFLVNLPATRSTVSDFQPLSDAQALLESQEDLQIHETYSDLRARWGVDNSEDDPNPFPTASYSPTSKRKRKGREDQLSLLSVSTGTINEVKSITELRNKGESRRFQDELGYLFEGLDPESNVSIRRGSALEIITKFSDPEFARKAKVADFTVQAWEVLRGAGAGDGDKVLDSALVVFMAFVAQDVRDLLDLANRSDCVNVLFTMLKSLRGNTDVLGLVNSSMSPIELNKAGVPRAEKSTLMHLSKLVRTKLGVSSEEAMFSDRSLITQVLAVLPPSLHRCEHMPVLLECLLSEMALLPPRVSGYASGLSLLPPPSTTCHLDTPSFTHIDNCLCLLETYLLGRWDTPDGDNDTPSGLLINGRDDLAKGLIACCVAADILVRDSKSEDMSTLARKCLESSLRVLVNLSHESEAWCRLLLQDEYTVPMITRFIIVAHRQRYGASRTVEQDLGSGSTPTNEESNVIAFDRLCLALGFLTNLVQVNEAAKDLTRETRLDLSCLNKRSCVRVCTCPQRISALECLVHIYFQHHKGSSEDEVDPVIRGYIAILFGLLMRDNISNQRILLAALPGTTNRARLAPLVATSQEFLDLYGEVMMRISLEGKREIDPNGTDESAWVGKTQHIANDVVAFLEVLSESSEL